MAIIVLNQKNSQAYENVVYNVGSNVTDMVIAREIKELNDNGILIVDDVLGESLRKKGYEIEKVPHSDFIVNINVNNTKA